MRRMLFLFLLLGTVLIVQAGTGLPIRSGEAWLQKIDAGVWETAVSQTSPTEFLVMLTPQADLSAARTIRDKTAKGRYVYEQLTAVAEQSQPALTAQLDTFGVSYRPFWITNMIWVRGDETTIAALARRTDVERILANPSTPLDKPETAVSPTESNQTTAIPWGITQINADDVWIHYGVTGVGVVIGGQDTGYDWDHEGLINQYRGWDGSTANHAYSWHDAIHENNPLTGSGNPCGFDVTAPCDDQSHGTHTMGTMVGSDLSMTDPAWPEGADNAVGVAPGAKWIGCRNMEEGYGTPATYAECYEWFVAPYPPGGDPMTDGDPAMAPHVINNSWGCPPFEGCTDPEVLLTVVDNVRAAGIVTVHSAGNEGFSGCGSIANPAAIYDSSFTVGNTTSSDLINGGSSRGPAVYGGLTLLKPDISAPGTGIRSTIPNDSYASFTGTSMAGPHVAGVVALLISAKPSLAGDVDAIEQIIRDTAVTLTSSQGCGGDAPTDVPNHVYGYGRINAYAAVDSLIPKALPYHYWLPMIRNAQ